MSVEGCCRLNKTKSLKSGNNVLLSLIKKKKKNMRVKFNKTNQNMYLFSHFYLSALSVALKLEVNSTTGALTEAKFQARHMKLPGAFCHMQSSRNR